MVTVLVVDDDRNMIRVLDFAFQQAGFSVMIARDGNEGWTLATGRPPDVAVLDVMMPGVHGYELCRRLRAEPKTEHVKIVFLTARSQPIDEREGLKAGADLFLSKPVLPSELIQKVKSLLTIARGEPAPATATEPEAVAIQDAVPTERVAVARPASPPLHPAAVPVSGRLIVCLGGCRGVGVTTLAANLAVGFALARQAETPLVELHSAPGNLLAMLGLASGPPYGDLKATGDLLNWDTLSLHLMDHPTGVRVLPAPPAGSQVPATMTERAVDILRARFPLTLADAASEMDERVESVVLSSDLVIVVTTPEVVAVRCAWQVIQELYTRSYPKRQIMLVVDHIQPQGGLPIEQIREAIKHPILAVIPHHQDMELMVDIGKPVILTQPGAPMSLAVGRVVTQLGRALDGPLAV